MISERAIFLYFTKENRPLTAIELVQHFDGKIDEVLPQVIRMAHEGWFEEPNYQVWELSKQGKKEWKNRKNDELAKARDNWKKRHWPLIAVISYFLGVFTKILIDLLLPHL